MIPALAEACHHWSVPWQVAVQFVPSQLVTLEPAPPTLFVPPTMCVGPVVPDLAL
jgi:hypothetical protein